MSAPDTNGGVGIAAAWAAAADRLAAWADAHLVNRRDAFGSYLEPAARTDDRNAITAKRPLTLQVLARHFRGASPGDLIGLHLTARDEAAGPGEVAACWSRWLGVDIDRHDERTDPGATLRAALTLAARAEQLGFTVLLLDSNGRGGYHLILVFDAPTPTAKVHAFGKWLVRDWKALGLDVEPEVFPKQAAIARGMFGNWLRLPGRHHTHDHFTRAWDGAGWLEGRAAVGRILATGGNPANLIPAEALRKPPAPRPKAKPKPEDVGRDATLAALALDYLDPSMGYDDWLRVGMSLTPLGREGLDLWDPWSSKSDKYEEGLCDRKWRTFGHGENQVALGTLFHMAKAKGFEFPKATKAEADGADADGEPAPAPDPTDLRARLLAIVRGEGGWPALYDDAGILAELARLEAMKPDKFASISASLRAEKRFAARDFTAAMKPHRAAARVDTEADDEGPDSAHWRRQPAYSTRDSRIVMTVPDDAGRDVSEYLTNFDARIVRCDVRDHGGANPPRTLRIRASIGDQVNSARTIDLPAGDFDAMNWIVPRLGPNFRLEAGREVKGHVRCAIQQLSGEVPEVRTYTHTGWREVGDGWAFMHVGGAITADGNDPEVSVSLDGADACGTKLFRLPDPPAGPELHRAIQACLGLFRLAVPGRPNSAAMAAVLFASPWRAAIAPANFAIQFYGDTDCQKSSAAALAQQHFGPGMDAENFPANWESDTVNSIGEAANRCNCVIMVVDDFIPRGTARDISEKHLAAARFLQGVGNRKGRQRLNRDGSAQEDKPPNCLAFSTGEDRIRHTSADARTLAIRFSAGETGATVDKEALTPCQDDANGGVYALAMAGFVRWLAGRLDEVRASLPARVAEHRRRVARAGDHGRTPEIVAHLCVGAETFLRFAVECGAIDQAEADHHQGRVEDGLDEAIGGTRQDRRERGTPGEVFLRHLAASLEAGRAYLSDKDVKDAPDGLEPMCGWRQEYRFQGGDRGQVLVWTTTPSAPRVGWVDAKYVYLHPENAYRAVKEHSRLLGEEFPTSPRLTYRNMIDAKLIDRIEDPRNKDGKERLSGKIHIGAAKAQVAVHRVPIAVFWPSEAEVGADVLAGDLEEVVG